MARNSVSTQPAPAPALRATARGGLDSLDFIDGMPGLIHHERPAIVPRGAPLAIVGWMVDERGRPVPEVDLVVDGVHQHPARTGIARGDVAEREDVDEFVGFRGIVPTDGLLPGVHNVLARAVIGGASYEAFRATFHVYDPGATGGPGLNRPVRIVTDRVGPLGNARAKAGDAIPKGAVLQVAGWAYDALERRAPALVRATLADRMWTAPCIAERPDAAATLGAAATALGFELLIPTASLERGVHRLTLAAYDADGRQFANTYETRVAVAGEQGRFPLVARERPEPPRAAVVCRIGEDDAPRPLPPTTGVLDVLPGTTLELFGWALNAAGAGADRVYVEIAHAGVLVPPARVAAVAGFTARLPRRSALAAPCDDASFAVQLDTAALLERDYTLCLLVVEPDRRSVARLSLGTLRVSRKLGRGRTRSRSRRYPRRRGAAPSA